MRDLQGNGQVSYFKGVSRFLLSTEECGACAGTGFQLDFGPEKTKGDKAREKRKSHKNRKK